MGFMPLDIRHRSLLVAGGTGLTPDLAMTRRRSGRIRIDMNSDRSEEQFDSVASGTEGADGGAGTRAAIVQPISGSEGSSHGVIITGLADLPAKTLLDEAALAVMLGRSKRSIRRMVSRLELPPPVR